MSVSVNTTFANAPSAIVVGLKLPKSIALTVGYNCVPNTFTDATPTEGCNVS